MADLEKYRRHIHDEVDRIVRWTLDSWVSMSATEPWLKLPADLDQDHLPVLLRHLANAALQEDAGLEEARQLVWTAAKHGQDRREDGFDESLLHTEYLLLRRTLWSYLKGEFRAEPTALDSILRIDAAITLASSGSLLGYHRGTLEKAGRWPDGIETVVRDWSFHSPPG